LKVDWDKVGDLLFLYIPTWLSVGTVAYIIIHTLIWAENK
jgi:hypothetical protein